MASRLFHLRGEPFWLSLFFSKRQLKTAKNSGRPCCFCISEASRAQDFHGEQYTLADNFRPKTARSSRLCLSPSGLGPGGPHWRVVSERDRGAGPAWRGLRQAHSGAEMAQTTDRSITLDRPAVDVCLRQLLRYIPEGGLGHLTPGHQPASHLRQRDAYEPAAAFAGATRQCHHRAECHQIAGQVVDRRHRVELRARLS